MSTLEAHQENPLKNDDGLSVDQQVEAARFQGNRKFAHEEVRVSHSKKERDAWNSVYLGFIPGAIERAIDRMDARIADKKATKHYKAHEPEYQAQAVKDAKADGIETSFGSDSKE